MRNTNNKTLLYLIKPGIRHRLDGPISTAKTWVSIEGPKFSYKFNPIPQNPKPRLTEGKFECDIDKNHQKLGIKYL